MIDRFIALVIFIKNVSSFTSYKKTSSLRNSSTFVYEPILMNICLNDDIIKTQFLINCIWTEISLLCYGEVLCFFTLRPSDLISTLTYVLLDNFCPCFIVFSVESVSLWLGSNGEMWRIRILELVINLIKKSTHPFW